MSMDMIACEVCGLTCGYTSSGMCPECEYSCDDHVCYECGGAVDRPDTVCDECRKDDCLNCGMCEECIDRTIAAHEEYEETKRRRVQCEVCGRGLNAEDLEMNTGMCIPCAME